MSTILSRSPLVMVLAQIRFPAELSKLTQEKNERLDALMDEIGYPMVTPTSDMEVQNGEAGPELRRSGFRRVYSDQQMAYNVSVGGSFVTLYSIRKNDHMAYAGHEDFCNKLAVICDAVATLVGDVAVRRIGYRYIDRLELRDADAVLLPECQGYGIRADRFDAEDVEESIMETLFSFPQSGRLRVRSGILSAGNIVDPSIPPVDRPTWILDLDSFEISDVRLGGSEVNAVAKLLSERAHSFLLEHAVNDEFEKRFI